MNNVLLRVPLAGCRVLEYDSGVRGQLCKTINVLSHIALLALAGLVIANVASPLYLGLGVMSVSVVAFGSFVFGSSNKRNVKPLLFEMMVASVCTALSVMAAAGLLTSMQFGVGLLACVAGGVAIANCFEKSPVKESTSTPDTPSLPLRVADKVIGLGRDLSFTPKTLFSRITHRKNYAAQIENDPSADALCVMIHGLKGSPSIFDDYHDSFARFEDKKVTLFQPHVPQKGNCSLEDASSPIYNEVLSWARQNPAKPIVIVGVSNGARIAGHLSAKLKSEGLCVNPMHVSCIAGPFNGTKLVNQPDWPGFLRSGLNKIVNKLYTDEVLDELSWDSACAGQVISEMQRAAGGNLHYYFYSTSSDTQINPFTSAFPEVTDANYFLTFAEGHQSVVRAAKDSIIERSFAAIS